VLLLKLHDPGHFCVPLLVEQWQLRGSKLYLLKLIPRYTFPDPRSPSTAAPPSCNLAFVIFGDIGRDRLRRRLLEQPPRAQKCCPIGYFIAGWVLGCLP
jgi:hypothetical protein